MSPFRLIKNKSRFRKLDIAINNISSASQYLTYIIFAIVFSMLLTACGGGGGGNDTSSETTSTSGGSSGGSSSGGSSSGGSSSGGSSSGGSSSGGSSSGGSSSGGSSSGGSSSGGSSSGGSSSGGSSSGGSSSGGSSSGGSSSGGSSSGGSSSGGSSSGGNPPAPAIIPETPTSSTAPILLHNSFHSAGIIITADSGKTVQSTSIELQRPSDIYRSVYPLTRYDGLNWATSIFRLQPNTRYNLRFTLNYTDSSTDTGFTQINTRAEFSVPAAVNTFNVSNNTELNAAITAASGGDHIVIANGTYSGVSISGRNYSADTPLVIRAAIGAAPQFTGSGTDSGFLFVQSSHIVLQGLRITNFDKGVYINSSDHITVIDNTIYDNVYTNILVSKGQLRNAPYQPGYNLILNNTVYSTAAIDCAGGSNSACPSQTYHGFQQQFYPGGGTVVRGNTFYGHVDNISPCAEQGNTSGLINAEHALSVTGGTYLFNNHDLEIYENQLSDSRDDHIELDGTCVNTKVYNNTMSGKGHTVFSVAPALPGPYFIFNNRTTGDWTGGSIKMNTNAGNVSEPSRNIYFYHNNFVRNASSSSSETNMVNLWYDRPGEHAIRVQNLLIKNNIFLALNNMRLTSTSNGLDEHPTLDYNLWFSGLSTGFSWNHVGGYNFEGFQLASSMEGNGLFSDPLFTADYSKITTASPAVNAAEVIPGINNHHSNAPDIGADEVN